MIKILFRTAGGRAKGEELGLGHIYRSINLAKSLKRNKIYFLLEDFGGAKEILVKNGFSKIKNIKNNIKNFQDYKETELQVKRLGIDMIIVDRYKISKSYVKKLSKKNKVVVISDLNDISFDSDLVVNGFIGFKNNIIKNEFGSKCVVGPNFQILDKQFFKKKKVNSKKYDLLISFGGFDEKNITGMITEILPLYLDKLKVEIILGPVNRKKRKLYNLQKKYPKNLFIKESTSDMAKEMCKTKYGLCSGGLTSYEFVSMGIPIGIIPDDNHQIITAKHWEKLGFAKNLGIISETTREKTDQFLREIYQGKFLTKTKKIIVDGNGVNRVSNEILKIK